MNEWIQSGLIAVPPNYQETINIIKQCNHKNKQKSDVKPTVVSSTCLQGHNKIYNVHTPSSAKIYKWGFFRLWGLKRRSSEIRRLKKRISNQKKEKWLFFGGGSMIVWLSMWCCSNTVISNYKTVFCLLWLCIMSILVGFKMHLIAYSKHLDHTWIFDRY